VGVFDPISQPDPDREERLKGSAGRIEIRPAERAAMLGIRALACPSCGAPIAIGAPIAWGEEIACAFCESVAPLGDYVREAGWPPVDVIARLG
jgi:hypothetical protein